jgi:hypothetical protein
MPNRTNYPETFDELYQQHVKAGLVDPGEVAKIVEQTRREYEGLAKAARRRKRR